ncbi:hypothetical protein A3A93_02545 [Candidatus Roizmanbacteria bacterium RIFCSPLOWO2_01_FULL_38_12]|uniref:DUF5678 domain-containing protein n=1 Tax=Candidatus Roizmanbacteria bacterium RIFCSPLOWO2_01_FULL_38_12 TaxID=1802061 RepID=A0A1F7J0B5_9BACT|nr:MAG: hypothetical protein A2861_00440 [Candidatus Roizmanbacteria bacterium RIFCSPHIGHO2_01_FULL_38_15]OGK49051.1 MAG: hypothetical protein A3A93_02545 [Candidatus Roizmanbacteria bacterium RIFCSPLOWO2_01_FULL_38_12]
MTQTNLKQLVPLLKPFINKWVAFSENKNEVIASGSSIMEVEKKLRKTNKKASVIQFILPFNSNYAPYVFTKKN